jgi:hypothetical protein
MPFPMSTQERAKPIMEYVWGLQTKVLALRNEVKSLRNQLNLRRWEMFVAGLVLGTAAEYLIMRYLVR